MEQVNPSSWVLPRQRTPPISPTGSFGNVTSTPVSVRSTCNTPTPSSFTTKATSLPSAESLNSSTSQGMRLVR